MRTRVAGIIPMEGGFALMHRTGNKVSGILDYYVFPGGGLEEGETLEEGTAREIKEEFGIEVAVKEKIYEYEFQREDHLQKEYFFLCEYLSGEFGTGDGPEFNKDPKYADRGNFIPEIITIKDLEKINLLPQEIRNKFIEDAKIGRFWLTNKIKCVKIVNCNPLN